MPTDNTLKPSSDQIGAIIEANDCPVTQRQAAMIYTLDDLRRYASQREAEYAAQDVENRMQAKLIRR